MCRTLNACHRGDKNIVISVLDLCRDTRNYGGMPFIFLRKFTLLIANHHTYAEGVEVLQCYLADCYEKNTALSQDDVQLFADFLQDYVQCVRRSWLSISRPRTIPPPGPSAAARQILNDIKKDDLIVSCIKALEISFDLSRLAPRRSRAYILVMVLISTFLLAVSEVAERSEGRRYTLESFNFLQRATREARQAVAMDVAQHCDQTRVDVPTPESNTFPVLSNRNDSHFQYQLLNLAMTCDTVFGLTRAANALHNLLLENSGILEERIITCSRSMVEEAAEFADNDVFELATILAAIPSVNFHLNMDLIQDAARAVYVAAGLRRDLDVR
uniref:Uncharacterized protein n=1 Tax=Psilocybe cubensis TaxID=181762 RepID=A0A8H8CL46_PSICU